MSTPRTDTAKTFREYLGDHVGEIDTVEADFARQLETELTAATARAESAEAAAQEAKSDYEELRKGLTECHWTSPAETERLKRELVSFQDRVRECEIVCNSNFQHISNQNAALTTLRAKLGRMEEAIINIAAIWGTAGTSVDELGAAINFAMHVRSEALTPAEKEVGALGFGTWEKKHVQKSPLSDACPHCLSDPCECSDSDVNPDMGDQ